MVAKRKKRIRKISRSKKHRSVIDSRWALSNSLLIFVIGLMFLGYGAAEMGYSSVTGYQVLPGKGCEGLPPEPSAWGPCTDGVQKRVVYICDESTGNWVAEVETRECKPEFVELPVAYILVGVVLVALAAVSLLLYKRKYKMPERSEVPGTW